MAERQGKLNLNTGVMFQNRSDSLSVIAEDISTLQHKLDSLRDEKMKQMLFDALPMEKQKMLDALWAQLYSDRGRKNIPISGGHWTGETGNSFWIPDDYVIPPDKGYSNMYHKTWRIIKAENRIHGIEFLDGRVDFKPVSKCEVVFSWNHELGNDGIRYLLETGDRQYLHEAAFALLAKKMHKSVEHVKSMKESQNLVWHEEPDCKTLRLVVREVHDNIKHFGGIAMLAVVCDGDEWK